MNNGVRTGHRTTNYRHFIAAGPVMGVVCPSLGPPQATVHPPKRGFAQDHTTPMPPAAIQICPKFVVLCPVLTPLILAWLIFLAPIWAHAQPIPPLDVPMRRATQVPQDVDLPYKPPPQDVLESGESTIEDFMLPVSPDATSGESNPESGESVAKPFDWTTLPHIPFKRPELKPAPDPEY